MAIFKRLKRIFFPATSPPQLSSLDAYALWSVNYPARAHNILMQIEQNAMLQLLPDLSDSVVLDLACGTGRYGLLAQAQGAQQVIGIDNSVAMLKANELNHIALATVTAVALPSEAVDVVLCGLALGHLANLTPALKEISRVLKPDGIALISDFHPFQYLSGAQRTFRARDGQEFAVEHYPHLYADYHQAGGQAGFIIDAVVEPVIEAGVPVVLILRFRKASQAYYHA